MSKSVSPLLAAQASYRPLADRLADARLADVLAENNVPTDVDEQV